mmetsp:Transcript_32555/g.75861  ORF Transcript_32555/g.75861 Transcript_32555/m.75861 type:complete len:221 (+) Transcript_32555:270-932(+)
MSCLTLRPLLGKLALRPTSDPLPQAVGRQPRRPKEPMQHSMSCWVSLMRSSPGLRRLPLPQTTPSTIVSTRRERRCSRLLEGMGLEPQRGKLTRRRTRGSKGLGCTRLLSQETRSWGRRRLLPSTALSRTSSRRTRRRSMTESANLMTKSTSSSSNSKQSGERRETLASSATSHARSSRLRSSKSKMRSLLSNWPRQCMCRSLRATSLWRRKRRTLSMPC